MRCVDIQRRADEHGVLQPALATAWQQVSSVAIELELRQGVRFHNGDELDADDVLASFAAHNAPQPSPAHAVILGMIKHIHKLDRYRVRVESAAPDVLLLRRLRFLQIYPKRVLEREGRDGCNAWPIGTGAYKLARYAPGREIILQRNPQHWAELATIDQIELPILRQKEWVQRLSAGEIDVALNLDSHDCLRAQRMPNVRGASREAGLAQYFLLANTGPCSDVRVRRALNHALNRRILVELTEHGRGLPQRSMASPQMEGFTELEPYRYSPELARQLLQAAGHGNGFRLRGLVSETSTALYFAVREFLWRIDVSLEAEIVPRGVWMQTMMDPRRQRGAYDFAVTSCDNPMLHALFLHFAFCFSHGPGSLASDAGFDELLLRAASAVDAPLAAISEVERYHRDQALMLFTVQQHVHAAWREGIDVVLPRSGHFGAAEIWKLKMKDGYRPALPISSLPEPPLADLSTLLDATSHTGAFYLPSSQRLREPTAQRIWTNLTESEQRWRMQNEPMLRELVNSLEARTNLANVLSSTDRVAIAGYSSEGRHLFHNRGYELMFDASTSRSVIDILGDSGAHGWPAIRSSVDREGAWLGPLHIDQRGRPKGAPERLFLTVSRAQDEDAAAIGYTFVFSDFSGEEERIRTAATRTILESVPYGLFITDRQGRMQSGYSDACRAMFPGVGSTELTGRALVELLALDPRRAAHFQAADMQVFDDVLPAEVSLGQLPQRIAIASRTFSLRGSVVRDDDGTVAGVLFTMLDISPLIAAEREAEHHRATVMILRHRDSFEYFARDLNETLGRWAESTASELAAQQPAIRASLHTAKGVFGQFALHDLAEHIHQLEDQEQIAAQALSELRRALHQSLQSHGLELASQEPVYRASESFLRELEASMLEGKDALQLRAAITEGLQRLRDKPAQDLLGPLAEAAEQLAKRRDKQVRVLVEGSSVRVPLRHQQVLGRLTHLVRNAIDHGLELPHERARAGKDETGTLSIRIAREHALLRVDVSDDGRGIDARPLIERALAMHAISDAQAATLNAHDALQLVFLDGLSTAEAVSDISGRGVGMGATKREVEAAGGRIDLESSLGRGTRVSIRLPL